MMELQIYDKYVVEFKITRLFNFLNKTFAKSKKIGYNIKTMYINKSNLREECEKCLYQMALH